MEKIMSESNDTPKSAALEDHRPLADSELDAVTGGISEALSLPYEEVKFEYTERTLGGPDTRPAQIRAR
jgi:hypothetical protein